MSNQNLIIYDFENLFNILDEIKDRLNYKIINAKTDLDTIDFDNSFDYLIITQKQTTNITTLPTEETKQNEDGDCLGPASPKQPKNRRK